MARVLFISKPIAPPWNDSSKNLVRDLASNLKRHRPAIMSKKGSAPILAHAEIEPIYPADVHPFAPAFSDNLRVLRHLLTGSRADLWHFFFAPNPRTSTAGAWTSRLRRVRTVQTICSAPKNDQVYEKAIFADRTVVLSKSTEKRLLAAGIPAAKIRRIAPCVPHLEPLSDAARSEIKLRFSLPLDRPVLLYPGDLEFSGGAERAIFALADLPRTAPAHLAMACRGKTSLALQQETNLRALVAELGLVSSVTWIGETSDIVNLLGSAEIVLLPAEALYAKMDLPLALIEAMALKRPVLVGAGTPAEELAEGGGALAVDPTRDATSAAVLLLLNNLRECIKMGEKARQTVFERYGAQAMAAAYEQLYDELLE
jgi:glycosyltransferase involved in cell wall biosynthesis